MSLKCLHGSCSLNVSAAADSSLLPPHPLKRQRPAAEMVGTMKFVGNFHKDLPLMLPTQPDKPFQDVNNCLKKVLESVIQTPAQQGDAHLILCTVGPMMWTP